MIALTDKISVSDVILHSMGYPPARKLIDRPDNLTVSFSIPATTFMNEVAAIQMALGGGGYASANSLGSECFWTLAADVLMEGIYAEIESLNIEGFDCEHEVVPDGDLNPHIEGVVVCATIKDAVMLKLRLG